MRRDQRRWRGLLLACLALLLAGGLLAGLAQARRALTGSPADEGTTPDAMIASLVGDVFVVFNLMMAICLIALTPSVLLVLLLRKFVVEGLTAGGVKG